MEGRWRFGPCEVHPDISRAYPTDPASAEVEVRSEIGDAFGSPRPEHWPLKLDSVVPIEALAVRRQEPALAREPPFYCSETCIGFLD